MIFSDKSRRFLFIIFAFTLTAAALYHLSAAIFNFGNTPLWRHLVFFVVDLCFAYGTLKRPAYFIYFIAVFVVQQYVSHGIYLEQMWQEKKQIHWISVIDLVLCPIGLICLIEDNRIKKRNRHKKHPSA